MLGTENCRRQFCTVSVTMSAHKPLKFYSTRFHLMALQRLPPPHFLALFNKILCYMGVFPMKYKNYFSLNALGKVWLPSSSLVITHSQVHSQLGLGESQRLSEQHSHHWALICFQTRKQRREDWPAEPQTTLSKRTLYPLHTVPHRQHTKMFIHFLKFCFHVYCEDLEKFKGL